MLNYFKVFLVLNIAASNYQNASCQYLPYNDCSAYLKFWKSVLCGSSVCFWDSEVQLYLVCCIHSRHAKNVHFIPLKCLLRAHAINEGLSVVEMRFLIPVSKMQFAASGTSLPVTCCYGGLVTHFQCPVLTGKGTAWICGSWWYSLYLRNVKMPKTR